MGKMYVVFSQAVEKTAAEEIYRMAQRRKEIQAENGSCKTCQFQSKMRCQIKKKVINAYNYCDKYIRRE